MISYEVARLEKSQLQQASEIAAKAFEDDPVFGYLTPDEKRSRLKALTWLTSRAVEYCDRYGQIYTTSNLHGVAAWLPPDQLSSDLLHLFQIAVQLHLYAIPFKCGWNRLWRWRSFLLVAERFHQQDMDYQPHWYLAMMVVDLQYQRKGIGSALLQPILSQASREGLPCYLVTFTEQAVGFYQKNGFEIVRDRECFSDSPPFWTLKRNPSS
jgi:ribosomal protein S18 acetylase RimI-like enzyme